RSMRIGADRVATDDVIEVRSPYDDRLLATVPKGTAGHLDAAVLAARQRHEEGPLPRHQRAEILDVAARLLRERHEQFARLICDEAAKPIKTARIEATRAVDTFAFSAAVARTAASDVVPM